MKSKRIIHILFLMLCVNVNANDGNKHFVYSQLQVDSLYSTYNVQEITEKNANLVIDWYQKKVTNTDSLANKDYKRVALSYAYLGNASKAKVHLEKYIKRSYDINVLDNPSLENIKESKEYESLVYSYKPKIDGWILFFIASGIIGFFIALVINLRKKGDTIANLLISCFVLLHSLFALYVCLFASNYIYEFPAAMGIGASFHFLFGPLLYFYFKRLSEKHEFKLVDIFHLAPTIVVILGFMPMYLSSYDQKLYLLFNRDELLQARPNIIVFLKCFSLVIYGYFIYRIYKKGLKKEQKPCKEILIWKKHIVILNSLYALCYLFFRIVYKYDATVYVFRDPVVLVLCIIVLYVGYAAYVQPRIFSKKYLFADELLKYQKSGLTENFSSDLKEQLLHLLNEEKIYKMNSINLDMLSERLGTTRHNISQVINEHFDLNFFNLINKYRIKEAQHILKNDIHQNLNIIDVAYDVGFNNKVTFNKAFKEETKLTPTQFLQKINDNKGLATSA